MDKQKNDKFITDGRLILWHSKIYKNIDMGITREREFSNPESLIPLLDTIYKIGWHDCNLNYYINHGETNHSNLIIITIAGGGYLNLDGISYNISPNTIAIIPNDTNTVYYTDIKEGHWEFYWMHVKGFNVSNILQRLYQNHYYLIPLKNTEKYTHIFEEIINSHFEGNEMVLFNSRKISEILHLFVEEIIVGNIILSDNNNFIKTILQYIEANYMEYITVEDLAALVFVTPETVIRTFKKYTGYTPHAYLKMYRIMIACNMLSNTNHSVKDIALRVGYKSSSNFSAEFRNLKGISPIQFRNQYKKVIKQEDSL